VSDLENRVTVIQKADPQGSTMTIQVNAGIYISMGKRTLSETPMNQHQISDDESHRRITHSVCFGSMGTIPSLGLHKLLLLWGSMKGKRSCAAPRCVGDERTYRGATHTPVCQLRHAHSLDRRSGPASRPYRIVPEVLPFCEVFGFGVCKTKP